ncbi:MAG: radical SAM protein [Thermodesulfobacteriota bacterium]
MAEEKDYIFRYQINSAKEKSSRNPLLELIRGELASLMDLVTLFHKGEEVKVDGFRLLNECEVIHEIFLPKEEGEEEKVQKNLPQQQEQCPIPTPQLIENARLYEPRIEHIKKVLEKILAVVELEAEGKPVKIDGFRLKNLSHWLGPSSGDPAEVFDHLATRCDCACAFCYLKGNPPALSLKQPARSAEEEYAEALTRVKYFYPERRQSLFPTLGSPYEVLAHPYALDLLRELRRKTDRPLRLSTNGHSLTPKVIEELSLLQPIYLYLSLNSSSGERRKTIMHAPKAEIAIKALPLLKENRISYAVVIVPWPLPSLAEMLADLQETIIYADAHEAHLIEVSLPGYSKYFPEPPLFSRDELWKKIVETIRALRPKVSTPIIVKPSMFEEHLFAEKLNSTWLAGTVRNSPAYHGGLRSGDILVAINGLPMSNRPQTRDLLKLYHQQHNSKIVVTIKRGGEKTDKQIDPHEWDYPYHPATDHHLGIIFAGAGFRPSALEDLKSLIMARKAQRVLFLSSSLVKPYFVESLRQMVLPKEVQIQVIVPENRFFGGNIFMGDLLVVDDFIETIKEYLQKETAPDLIVLPATPFALGYWQRDLTGRVYKEIERAVGIPVVLLDYEVIYD